MSTGKTVLIAGGVVVGAFLLMKVIAPAPVVRKGPPSTTSSLSGIVGNIAAIGGGLASIFGSHDGEVVNTTVQTTPITDAQTDAFTAGHFGVDFSDL